MLVIVKNKDLEKAIKVLRYRLNKEGITRELKDKQYFLTRTQKRKVKDQRAEIKRHKREQRRTERKRFR